jgi:hypothetical protein
MKNILCTICAKVDAKVFLKNTGLDYKFVEFLMKEKLDND